MSSISSQGTCGNGRLSVWKKAHLVKMGKDFNPQFSFDVGAADTAVQAPWDFAGAAKEARLERTGTTLDEKIQRRLREKGPAEKGLKPAKAAGQATRQRKVIPAPRAGESEEISGESGESSGDDSDAPLPGELSDGDEGLSDGDESDEEGVTNDDESIGNSDGEEGGGGSLASMSTDASGDPSDPDSDAETPPHSRGQATPGGKARGGSDAPGVSGRPTGRATTGGPPAQSTRVGQSGQNTIDDRRGDETERGDRREKGGKRGPPAEERGGDANKRQKGNQGGAFFAELPDGTSFSAKSFEDLQLSRPLLKACAALGYTHPTPIQAAVIPLALMGRDISGSAMTGSGKTAAFTLPILERLLYRSRRQAATYALILAPTRELAVQVHSMVGRLAQFTDIRTALVVGGLSLQAQATALRASPEIVVATPGRLIDHLRNTQTVGLEDLQALILDEADRLLQMGFSEEIAEILKLTPRKRQTMLFSATMTEEVKRLAALSLQRPVRLAADPTAQAPRELVQEIIRLKGSQVGSKEAILMAVCSRSFEKGRTIVFFRTKQSAHRAKMLFGLAKLPPASELHGNMTQAARLEALEKFRQGEAKFLLATDVAARGLDILGVDVVINFDMPDNLAAYLHRIGRTARAGANGRAVTFVEDGDRTLLKEIVKKTAARLQARVVPQPAVDKWLARLESLEPDVRRLMLEEKEETVLRKAEMEAQKAENLIEHEAEIYARPARTWFQTEKQKRALGDLEKTALAAGNTQDEEEGGNAKARKNNKKAKEREERKRKRAEETAAAKKKSRNSLLEETEEVARSIRAAKHAAARLREEGMAPGKAGRAALAAVSGKSNTSSKKKDKAKKKRREAEGGGEGALFEGDGTGRAPASRGGGAPRVYAGGGRSGKVVPPGVTRSKREQNLAKRKGKGAKQFKSKARHKRR